jgi:hypothetical protein
LGDIIDPILLTQHPEDDPAHPTVVAAYKVSEREPITRPDRLNHGPFCVERVGLGHRHGHPNGRWA